MNTGEYPSPLTCVTLVQAPVVSGYVSARLRCLEDITPAISGEDTTMTVVFRNVGNTLCAVKLRQTTDRSISGVRIDVVSGISLVPGGRRTVSTQNARLNYLELYCYSGGPSTVSMEIASQRKWEQLGFDKVGDASFYPTSLWQAKAFPVAASVPGATQP